MQDHLKFSFPDEYTQKQLTGSLADHYGIKKDRPMLKSMAIYDTFD